MADTAVPELSTWAMMVLGFAGLGFAAYRASPARPRGGSSGPDYFAFLFSVSMRSLAAGPDEAGFWPVISWPSATV